MHIHQFYDTYLAHASYIIISNGAAAVVDPSRNPQPYYEYAKQHNAVIKAVIETHPHADFVSSHLEIAQTTGAKIYQSKLVEPEYSFVPFDDGDILKLGNITLQSLNTPGHSPDSISVVVMENGTATAVFTGDTLFIGDVGRPDLRETAGAITQKREELARAMYHSLRTKLLTLPDDTIVYPAHGAGSLCGKNLSKDTQSTIGRERISNYALQEMSEAKFIELLLADQPFVPKYFGFDVEMNKKGAAPYATSIANVKWMDTATALDSKALVIDTRAQEDYRKGHIPNAINNVVGGKFETWLGAVVGPEEKFYLVVTNKADMPVLLDRIARIGYEGNVLGVLQNPTVGLVVSDEFDAAAFEANTNQYTIVDIRNNGEVADKKIFEESIHIPLYELRERAHEIPTNKPIVVHCAGGYRSAVGSSIVKNELNTVVYDMGTLITEYAKKLTV